MQESKEKIQSKSEDMKIEKETETKPGRKGEVKEVKPRLKKEGRKLSISREKWQQMKEKAKLAEERLDRLLRLQAEFENYRKRVNRERSEFIQYAIEDLICDLLPVIDNFERAIESARRHDNSKALLQGVEMIYKQVHDVLVKRGLEKIEAVGKEFDPREHEAVMQVESENHPDNIIIEANLAGYRLKDKVIRPAMVKVSKKKAESDKERQGTKEK